MATIRTLAAQGLAVVLSTHEPEQAFAIRDRVAVLGPRTPFTNGPIEEVLTPERLSTLYDVPLTVERTPSGRNVVGPAA